MKVNHLDLIAILLVLIGCFDNSNVSFTDIAIESKFIPIDSY